MSMQGEYGATCAGIPILEGDDRELLDAAKSVVLTKGDLDRLYPAWVNSMLKSSLDIDTIYGNTIEPFTFAFSTLPFFELHRRETRSGGRHYKALVPTDMVIGESWKWEPKHLSEEEQDTVLRLSFAAFSRSRVDATDRDCPNYAFIKPLGMVLAFEGKNRVALFRQRRLPYIPALVSDEDYPRPERIRIYMLPNACLAVLDNRYVERVRAFPLVERLLRAYGVAINDTWPTDFPDIDRVLAGFTDIRFQDRFFGTKVDLQELKADEDTDSTEVTVSLLDVANIRTPSLKFNLWCIGTVLMLTTGVNLTGQWPDVRALLAFGLGVVSMLLLVQLLPLFQCEVRNLKEQSRWKLYIDIRNRILRRQQQ